MKAFKLFLITLVIGITFVGAASAQPQNMVLAHGWNLAAYFVQNDTLMASGVSTGSGIDKIASYNGSSQLFGTFLVGRSHADKDFHLVPDAGYFFNATRDNAGQTFNGVAVDSPRYISLYQYWNLIGWSSSGNLTAQTFGGLQANITKVAGFSSASGLYSTYLVGISHADKNFNMSRSNGYFTYTNAHSLVNVTVITPPVANFTANVTSGIAWDAASSNTPPAFGAKPLAVQFYDTSAGATAWQWNFGDGTANSTVQNPVHSFVNAWSYNVTLTVTRSDGTFTTEKYGYINVLLPVVGNVAHPMNLSVADLQGYPQISIVNHTYGAHHLLYNMTARGASFNAVLNAAQPSSGASLVTYYASDGITGTDILSDIRADSQSMIATTWYSNDSTNQSGDNQTLRNILPSQTYAQTWTYDLIAINVQ